MLRDVEALEDQPHLFVPSMDALTAEHVGQEIVSQDHPGETYVGSEAELMIYDPALYY